VKKINSIASILLSLVLLGVNCADRKESEDRVITEPVVVPLAEEKPDSADLKLTRLWMELEMIKASISKKENEFLEFSGDATRSTLIVTNPDATQEEQEIARERANLSLKAAEKCKKELKELQAQQSGIEMKIETYKPGK
jgi:hypothetical protein